MWRADAARPCAALHVVVGAGQLELGLRAGRQWLAGSLRSMPLSEVSMPGLLAACGELARAGEDGRKAARIEAVHVLVADFWLMAGGVPWSDALQAASSAGPFVRDQLAGAGFDVQPDDLVRLEDGAFEQPRLAVCFPAELLSALAVVAQGWGSEARSVLPVSAAAWAWGERQGTDTGSPMAVWMPGGFLMLQGARRLTEVAVRRGLSATERACLSRQSLRLNLQRMCVRNPRLAQRKSLRGLNLWPNEPAWPKLPLELAPVPAPVASDPQASPLLGLSAWSSTRGLALDAAPAVGGRSAWPARLAALVLLAGAGSLGAKAWGHWEATRAADQKILALQESRRAVPGDSRRGDARPVDPVRTRAVNAAVRELNLPVMPLLQALEAPRDLRVALLSVDVAGAGPQSQGQGTIKIVAEARNGADMARYVTHISDRKPIAEAYLVRHEVREEQAGRPYRFTVEATWQP